MKIWLEQNVNDKYMYDLVFDTEMDVYVAATIFTDNLSDMGIDTYHRKKVDIEIKEVEE